MARKTRPGHLLRTWSILLKILLKIVHYHVVTMIQVVTRVSRRRRNVVHTTDVLAIVIVAIVTAVVTAIVTAVVTAAVAAIVTAAVTAAVSAGVATSTCLNTLDRPVYAHWIDLCVSIPTLSQLVNVAVETSEPLGVPFGGHGVHPGLQHHHAQHGPAQPRH